MPLPESGSDGENGEIGEKPVRERLKQTTIDKAAAASENLGNVEEKSEYPAADAAHGTSTTTNKQNSAQKRTLDDAAHTESSPVSAKQGDTSDIHTRKRTREDQVLDNENEGTHPRAENGELNNTASSARGSTPPARDPSRLDAILTSPRKKRSRESLGIDEDLRHQKIPSTEETKARRSSSEERQASKVLSDEKPTEEEQVIRI